MSFCGPTILENPSIHCFIAIVPMKMTVLDFLYGSFLKGVSPSQHAFQYILFYGLMAGWFGCPPEDTSTDFEVPPLSGVAYTSNHPRDIPSEKSNISSGILDLPWWPWHIWPRCLLHVDGSERWPRVLEMRCRSSCSPCPRAGCKGSPAPGGFTPKKRHARPWRLGMKDW